MNFIRYSQNSKAYRCYKWSTGKIYKTYHVKFCKSFDDATQLPLPEHESNPPPDHQLKRPNMSTYDNDISMPSLHPQPRANKWDDQYQLLPPLHRSNCVPVLTARADLENMLSWVQKAVQEFIKAGECLRAARVSWRDNGVMDMLTNPAQQGVNQELGVHNCGTGDMDSDPAIPNLANVVSDDRQSWPASCCHEWNW